MAEELEAKVETQELEAKVETQEVGVFRAIALIIVAIAATIENANPTEMSNMFRVLYRSFLATVLILGGGWFLHGLAFAKDGDLNKYAGVIIGFITASVIGIAVSFYFGGQDRSKPVNTEEGGDK